ncbi:MAG: hypothetical protein IPP40_15640 [bacterium]|nr:hypothetical protein [bacterium]
MSGPFSSARMALLGNQLCVAINSHMRVYDLSDPTNPVLYSLLPINSQIYDIESDGEYLYLLANGFKVYDTSDSGNVQQIGSTQFSGTQFVLKGPRAFIAGNNSLRAVDISNPNLPVNLGYVFSNLYIHWIEANENLIVGTTDFRERLEFIDVSDPTLPVLLQPSESRSWFVANSLALNSTHAFVKNLFEIFIRLTSATLQMSNSWIA